MARGPQKLRVAADGVGLTQFGGVALIEHFFQHTGLQGAFSRHIRFTQRNNGYSISESLKALLYPLTLGLGRIETTEQLRHNDVFQYLAGLPGYPEAISLRRFLERLARLGRKALLQLHDRWQTAMLGQPARAIFDLDSTVLTVYGRQERAEVGYNPKKRGRPFYLSLFANAVVHGKPCVKCSSDWSVAGQFSTIRLHHQPEPELSEARGAGSPFSLRSRANLLSLKIFILTLW